MACFLKTTAFPQVSGRFAFPGVSGRFGAFRDVSGRFGTFRDVSGDFIFDDDISSLSSFLIMLISNFKNGFFAKNYLRNCMPNV